MENALIVSQIIFYSVFSLAIVVIGFLMAVIAYRLVKIIKELEIISKNIHDTSDEVRERVKDVLEKLSSLPILSSLLNKTKTKEKDPKSRKKTNKK